MIPTAFTVIGRRPMYDRAGLKGQSARISASMAWARFFVLQRIDWGILGPGPFRKHIRFRTSELTYLQRQPLYRCRSSEVSRRRPVRASPVPVRYLQGPYRRKFIRYEI
jgi:hypothetical protein